jgi:hypothetical protein
MSTPIDIDGTSFFVQVAPTDDPTAEMRVTVDGLVYSNRRRTSEPAHWWPTGPAHQRPLERRE